MSAEYREKDNAPAEIKMPDDVLMRVVNLKKYFPIKRGVTQRIVGYVKAVDGVSFDLKKGRTYGLVGESGCGKTTIGRTILRLVEPTGGHAYYMGKDLFSMRKKDIRPLRALLQIIFQDPYSSLDPRMPIGEIIGEAVKEHNIVPMSKWHDYVLQVMDDCELKKYQIDRYPHEFSGGQRQRICIARALALNPKLIVADEPVSALDVSIQAQVINLMRDLQEQRGLSYLFISHDLSVVEYISDEVGVMYLGSLVEMAPKTELFKKPLHPYTQALLSAVPVPDPDYHMHRIILQGDLPSPANPPKGCKFHTRCRRRLEICKEVAPEYRDLGGGHFCACHLFD